jgi:hypothetical protein
MSSEHRPTKIYSSTTERLSKIPGPLLSGGVKVLDKISYSRRIPLGLRGFAVFAADEL